MPPRRQSDLFESESPLPTARDLRILPQGRTPLGKEQQRFNRLLAQVQKLRGKLTEWGDFESRHRQQVGERLVPLLDAMTEVRRQLILQCHEMLAGRVGGRVANGKERRQLVDFVLDLCQAHLSEAEGDEAIIAVHDSHAGRPFAELQLEESEMARLVDEVFGDDPDDLGAVFWESDSPGSAGVGVGGTAADPSADDAPASQPGSRRKARARQREAERAAAAEQAAREMTQSVRDVYRKLASALHPDRAADAADRDRRHLLMQRVNQAYESVDLLSLLTLQLEIEQIDEDHLATVSQARLGHYNQILRGQVKELEQELSIINDRIRMFIPAAPRKLNPAALEHEFERALAQARNDLEELRQHAEDLLEPRYRRQWLREYALERQEDEDLMLEVEAMLLAGDDLSIDAFFGPPPAKRQNSSSKRKRKRR